MNIDPQVFGAFKDDLFALLKSSVKDLWTKEDEDFLKQLASDIAEQKLLTITTDNPEVHKQNLIHLAATLQAEIAIKKIQVEEKSKDLFAQILATIIKTVALISLKL